MLSRLFKKRDPVAVSAAPEVPANTVVWAVGDVHGRLDLLHPLVAAILADLQEVRAIRKVVIFLGDYIDRGPDSRSVVRFLADLPSTPGVEWRFLKGNHEQAMLDFLRDPAAGAKWCEYGGDRALRSYGLRLPDLAHKTEAWARVAADLQHKLSPREIEFLENLEFSLSVGDYFFAHAGARPGVPLDRQSPQELMWIRRPFLDSTVAFERVVVHGHTPTADVHADHRRIGLDTKAYESGVLTALRLEGDGRTILQAKGPGRPRAGTTPDAPGSDDGISLHTAPLGPLQAPGSAARQSAVRP